MTSTPLSRDKALHASGVGHCNAAIIVHQHLSAHGTSNTDSTWIALQGIIGLAAECSLKAFLATHGYNRKTLKDLGHNLPKLYEQALSKDLEQEGIEFGQPELAKAIKRFIELSADDYGSYNFRYIEDSDVNVLSKGEATNTVIRALQILLDIAEARFQASASAA